MTVHTSLPDAVTGALTPEAARAAPLLLLLSREHLTPAQAELARELAAGVDDWQAVVRIASRKLCLPFVYRHVAALGLLPKDAPERQAMRAAALAHAGRWLKLAAEQRRFLEACIAPTRVPHLFVKGVTLARYYDDPGLRTTRDIDVLVREADLDTVLDGARAHGYRVMLDVYSGRVAETARDLRAIRRYKTDVPLLSPAGTMVELHTALDKGNDIFDSDDMIARAEPVEMLGTTYGVLPTADLFVFLAYHHNRHVWSSLHWLGDADALRRAPDWSEDAIRARAGELGLTEAVEGTLAFTDLAGRPDRWRDAPGDSPARECLELCLLNLEGGKDTENAVIRENIALRTNWRVPEAKRRRATREAWKTRLTPNFQQYLAFPLPDWLQWLYPLEWAAGATRRLLTGERRPFERAGPLPGRQTTGTRERRHE